MTPLSALGIMGIAIVVISLLLKAFQCKHAWEFVDKTEFPPPIETAKKNGISVNYMWDSDIKEMSRKTVVIVLRCPKCGAAKILRETH